MDDRDISAKPSSGPNSVGLTLRDASGLVIATLASSFDGVYAFDEPPPPPTNRSLTSQLSGCVYLDVDRDGKRGADDCGLCDIKIPLVGIDSTTLSVNLQASTDLHGRFHFDKLTPGEYRLGPVTPLWDTRLGAMNVGTSGGKAKNGAFELTLNAGEHGERYDFSLIPLLKPQLPPSSFNRTHAPVTSAFSAVDLLFAEMADSSASASILNHVPHSAPTAERKTQVVPATLSGVVYHDRDQDGQFGSDDTPLADIEIHLEGRTQKGEPVNRSDRTAKDGTFCFADLPPGIYRLSRVLSRGFIAGNASVGTVNTTPVGRVDDESIAGIVLGSGETGLHYRFADVRACGLNGMVTSDDEFHEDGSNEVHFPGARILLSGTDDRGRTIQLAAETNQQGMYRFHDLRPGKYNLYATAGPGWNAREVRIGDKGGHVVGSGKVSAIHLRSGDIGTRYNFRMQGSGVISGRLWSGDEPAKDLVIRLRGLDNSADEVRRITSTDGEGRYRFVDLRAGIYRIEGCVDPITLTPGDQIIDCDQVISPNGERGV